MKACKTSWPLALLLAAALLGGCLEAPGIEETWTKIEIMGSTVSADTLMPGQSVDVRVDGRITFRSIHTGFLAAELRVADSLSLADYPLTDEDDLHARSREVAALLAATTPLGGDARAVTGFDHLIMEAELAFTGTVPADLGPGGGLWLLLFFGDGEEIRRAGMADTLVVTPVALDSLEILATGIALPLGATP